MAFEARMAPAGGTRQVSPFEAFLWSMGAFSAGAVFAGATSFARATKQLQEEGIDPRLRARALPLALKAFGISTGAICAVGGLGYVAFQYSGMETKNLAEVSSWNDAVEEIKRQQVAFKNEFQSRVQKLQNRE